MGHDGPSLASFVAEDERETLMAAFAATAYEHGYSEVRLCDVAARAGVAPAVAARCWPGELDCLLETVATFTRRLFHRAAVAFMGVNGDNALALHTALATVLTDATNAPEMTSISVIELPRLGPLAHERHQRMIALFTELLASGFAAMDHPPPNPDTLALCLGGSVWETIRRHAAERRLHELPDTLPALSHVCLSTLFGSAEAQRIATLPATPIDPRPDAAERVSSVAGGRSRRQRGR